MVLVSSLAAGCAPQPAANPPPPARAIPSVLVTRDAVLLDRTRVADGNPRTSGWPLRIQPVFERLRALRRTAASSAARVEVADAAADPVAVTVIKTVALAGFPQLQLVTAAGDVSAGGRVARTELADGTTLRDSAATRCMLDVFDQITFPEPEGGGFVTVVYPIDYRASE